MNKSAPSALQQATTSTRLYPAVLRPPQPLWNGQHYAGSQLVALDKSAAEAVPGVVEVVVKKQFIAVIAAQLHAAQHARRLLNAQWQAPKTSHKQAAALTDANFSRVYHWPEHTESQAAQAQASFNGHQLSIYANTAFSQALVQQIAAFSQLPLNDILIKPWPSSENKPAEAYDAAMDAAILAIHKRQTIVVVDDQPLIPTNNQLQFSAQLGAGNSQALIQACQIHSNQFNGVRPALATLLNEGGGQFSPTISSQTAYYPKPTTFIAPQGLVALSQNPQASPLAAQVFASESFFDEACRERGLDPIQARLDAMAAGPGSQLLSAVAKKANWQSQPVASARKATHTYSGRGVAYTHLVDHQQEPPQQLWSAWVVDIAVQPDTGAIDITGLTVGYHSDNLHPPTPATTSLENTVRQAASRRLDDKTSDRWGSAAANSTQAATGTVRPSEVQIVTSATDIDHHLAWNDSASLPAAAAIANAIHDATGVRLRQPPFEGEALRRQLGRQKKRRQRGWLAGLGAIAATAGGIVLSAMPWRPAIAPAAFIDTSIYSEEALNRGRLVAIAGDCMVCHTADSGPTNAGGLGLETPFGTIYSTNITPDKETGIGSWTYAAFERAMREGIHQDGRHLYPAFPYTAFAKISDADMQELYAWLMTQEPVKAQAPKNDLRFPYSVRPLLAGWNALFHRNTRFEPDPEQSTLWNRGAYLVNGMGHCAACHSPRNALGAEKNNGLNFLGGGFAEGWEAPPLNELSKAPLPWTESDLYTYLRTGFSSLHGVAAGPMAPVVKGLSQLPDSDVRAMAHYLASFAPDSTVRNLALEAAQLEDRSRNDESTQVLPGESLFDGACVMCHDARGGPPLFGARPSLALNTNLHSDLPDNVIQVLLHGIEQPALDNLGTMPAFGDSFNDQQLATLLRYMRSRFAPDKAPWQNIEEKIRQYRSSATNQ